jgi:hypothetical protein
MANFHVLLNRVQAGNSRVFSSWNWVSIARLGKFVEGAVHLIAAGRKQRLTLQENVPKLRRKAFTPGDTIAWRTIRFTNGRNVWR